VPVVCEVGPATVRLIRPGSSGNSGTCAPVAALATAALAAAGEPLTLVAGQPVPTRVVWRRVFERVLAGADTVALVHPSWWAPAWVDSVAAVARQVAPHVSAFPRSGLLHRGAAFVEIGPELVLVGDRAGRLDAESRLSHADDVAGAVVTRVEAGPTVHIDAPAGVAGAAELGFLVAARLRARGATVRHVDDRHLHAAASRRALRDAPAGSATAPSRREVRAVARVAAVLVAAAAAGVAVWGAPVPRAARTGETILVEGRVAVSIPADWSVERITAGPGSARVQAVSPVDPEAALHITQSPVPAQDLAATAAELRIAVDAQPPGVFLDFDADDRRGGRPAVTYREVRPGHDIRWNVVVTGGVRISIGCQSAPGRDHAVLEACERAIESAHEIR
jgi:type VII secretion-associated protein (TIGR03931 family)